MLPANTPSWGFWLMVGGSVLVGIALGIVCIKIYRVGVFILGCLFGVFIGGVLYMGVFATFAKQSWVLIIIMVVCGVAFGFIAWYANIIGVIVATSFIGSYMLVRACSWYIGGFPNEWTLY